MENTAQEEKQRKGDFMGGKEKAAAKHPGGRPTKYRREYCEKLLEYFNRPPQRMEYKREYFQNGNIKSETPMLFPEQYPTFELFAHSVCGATHQTLLNWCEAHEEFFEAYKRAKEIQKAIMTINAMSGIYNAAYAKFEAINNHGMRDKQETELSGKDGGLITIATEQEAKKALEALGYVKGD